MGGEDAILDIYIVGDWKRVIHPDTRPCKKLHAVTPRGEAGSHIPVARGRSPLGIR